MASIGTSISWTFRSLDCHLFFGKMTKSLLHSWRLSLKFMAHLVRLLSISFVSRCSSNGWMFFLGVRVDDPQVWINWTRCEKQMIRFQFRIELLNNRTRPIIRTIEQDANLQPDLVCCNLTNDRTDRYDEIQSLVGGLSNLIISILHSTLAYDSFNAVIQFLLSWALNTFLILKACSYLMKCDE